MRKVQHIDKRITYSVAYNDKKRRHYRKYGTLTAIIIVGYIMTSVPHLMANIYIVRMYNNQSTTYN